MNNHDFIEAWDEADGEADFSVKTLPVFIRTPNGDEYPVTDVTYDDTTGRIYVRAD